MRLWGGAFPADGRDHPAARRDAGLCRWRIGDAGDGWAEAGIIKDAGDDPDVTHGALIVARVAASAGRAWSSAPGEGVGTVTSPGLPIAVGRAGDQPGAARR